jgi:uncharacterized protein YndB with AHSA1/START domain
MYRLVHTSTAREATMEFEVTAEVDAPNDRVWATLTEVETWPEWTASVTRVEAPGDGWLAPGGAVRIRQPGMGTLRWEVIGLEPGRAFTWRHQSPGVTTEASHLITPTPDGRSAVTLGIRQWGPLAPLVGLVSGRRVRRYLHVEADGLKRRCEAG